MFEIVARIFTFSFRLKVISTAVTRKGNGIWSRREGLFLALRCFTVYPVSSVSYVCKSD